MFKYLLFTFLGRLNHYKTLRRRAQENNNEKEEVIEDAICSGRGGSGQSGTRSTTDIVTAPEIITLDRLTPEHYDGKTLENRVCSELMRLVDTLAQGQIVFSR